MANVQTLSDAEFETRVLQAKRPVMVDLGAEWCAPCRALAPILEKFAAEHAGEVDVYSMDIGENPNTPAKLGVMSVPTVVLFSGGQEVARILGLAPKDRLEELLRKVQTD